MDPLSTALRLAGSGLDAQSERLRVVSENIANAQSTGNTPGAEPYQRKTVAFRVELDRASGADAVALARIGRDDSAFPLEHLPGHEAADAAGYVKMPNVNMLVEMADLRQANRSYEANLQVFRQARELISMTIDLLRSNG